MCAKSLQLCLTLFDPVDCSPTSLLCPWDSPGKKTGVGCLVLLQGIFPIQESSPSLLSPALAGRFFNTSTTWEAHVVKCYYALVLEGGCGKPVRALPICGACSLWATCCWHSGVAISVCAVCLEITALCYVPLPNWDSCVPCISYINHESNFCHSLQQWIYLRGYFLLSTFIQAHVTACDVLSAYCSAKNVPWSDQCRNCWSRGMAGPQPSVKQWSISCRARGFKAIVLCDVLIRAQLGLSRIHYTDYRVSVLLWKLRYPPGPWLWRCRSSHFLREGRWWSQWQVKEGLTYIKEGEAFVFAFMEGSYSGTPENFQKIIGNVR